MGVKFSKYFESSKKVTPLPQVLQHIIIQCMVWGDPEWTFTPEMENYWKTYYKYQIIQGLGTIELDGLQVMHNVSTDSLLLSTPATEAVSYTHLTLPTKRIV